MKRLLYLVTFAVVALSPLRAQNVETVYSKDGSEYFGYISKQIPGKNITINAVKALIVVPRNAVRDIHSTTIPDSCLTRTAISSLKAMKLINDGHVIVSTVSTDKEVYEDVVIVKNDKVGVRFLSFANATYSLPWSLVRKTSKSPDWYVPIDAVLLKSGEIVKGKIMEQIVGESMVIKTDKGAVKTNMSEVISIASRLDSKEKSSIWRKIPLIDCLTMLDGTEYEGMITSRLLGTSITILLRSNGEERILPLKNIKVFRKVINTDVVCSDARRPAESGLIMKISVDSTVMPVKEENAVTPDNVVSETVVADSSVKTENNEDVGTGGIVINNDRPSGNYVEEKKSEKEAKGIIQKEETVLTIGGKRLEYATTCFDGGITYVVAGEAQRVQRGDYVTIDVSGNSIMTSYLFALKDRKIKNEESERYGDKYPSFSQTDDNPYMSCDTVRSGKSISKISFKITKKGMYALVLNDKDVILVEVE